jgi:hypothetical protein
VIVDPDFLDHWRTRMVVDALQDEAAPMYILRLWAHCQARKSDRHSMPPAGLKAQCRAPHDAAAFEQALTDAGFVERDGGCIVVLGWADQNAALLAAWENGAKGGRPSKKPKQNPRDTHGEPSGNPAVTHGEPNANPDETDKSREEKKPPSLRSGGGARAPEVARPDDVSESVWRDWKALRAKKRTTVSETGIEGARSEAHAASLTLEEFLRLWCTLGWQGLTADRIRPEHRRTVDGWRAEQRARTQLAAPGVAVASSPAAQFFIDVEATTVAPRALN